MLAISDEFDYENKDPMTEKMMNEN